MNENESHEINKATSTSEESLYEVDEADMPTFSNAAYGSSTAEEGASDGMGDASLKSSQTSEYLKEDEDFLNAEDEILYKDPATIASRSNEALITWAIEDFYNESGKVRNKYSLRNNPPKLKISSNNGDEAEFILTKNTSILLAKMMKDVNNAYYGVKPIEEKTFKEKISHYWGVILDNKIKAIVVTTIFLTLLLTSIFL